MLKSDETRELAKQILSLAATNRDLPDTSDQAFERFFSRRYVHVYVRECALSVR